jgi:hypothetical protein
VTIAPIRPALPAAPPPAGETLPELSPAVLYPKPPPAPATRSPRPHYIAAGITTAVLAADLVVWLLLRPLAQRPTMLLLLVATIAAGVLVAAAGTLGARPIPPREGR